jgi:hypothetical protein
MSVVNTDVITARECAERHRLVEARMDRIDSRLWTLVLLALAQLAGVAVLMLK